PTSQLVGDSRRTKCTLDTGGWWVVDSHSVPFQYDSPRVVEHSACPAAFHAALSTTRSSPGGCSTRQSSTPRSPRSSVASPVTQRSLGREELCSRQIHGSSLSMNKRALSGRALGSRAVA